MRELNGGSTYFDRIRRFLTKCGIMDESEASIYVLGLEKGVLTTRMVQETQGIRQSTAGDRLRRLSKAGYFEETPPKGGGRGRARKFRVVSPRTALSEILVGFRGFEEDLALVDEHLELLGDIEPEEEVWISSPQNVALKSLKDLVESATDSIQISSHDCTWLEEPELASALRLATEKNVQVTVLANRLGKEVTREKFSAVKIIEILESKTKGPAFLIVDSKTIVLPLKQRGISSEYHGLKITNKDLVERFLKLFEETAAKER